MLNLMHTKDRFSLSNKDIAESLSVSRWVVESKGRFYTLSTPLIPPFSCPPSHPLLHTYSQPH